MPKPPDKAKDVGPLDGARLVRSGFARRPEDDLAFAIGYPHHCVLVGDVAGDDDAALSAAISQEWLPRISRALAPRVARVFGLAPIGPEPVASARQQAMAAPLHAAEARKILAKRARGSSSGKDSQLGFLLEALVGPEVVVGAVIEAIERFEAKELARWNGGAIQLLRWGVGFALLRCPATVGAAFRARLEVVYARAVAAAKPDQSAQLRDMLDVVLHGAAGAERSGHRYQGPVSPYDLLFADDDPAYVVAQVQRHPIESLWRPWARLAFLGGEPVVAHYAGHWRKIRNGEDVRAFVRDFGKIDSPAVTRAIREIATTTSPAAADAAAWLRALEP